MMSFSLLVKVLLVDLFLSKFLYVLLVDLLSSNLQGSLGVRH